MFLKPQSETDGPDQLAFGLGLEFTPQPGEPVERPDVFTLPAQPRAQAVAVRRQVMAAALGQIDAVGDTGDVAPHDKGKAGVGITDHAIALAGDRLSRQS